MAEELTAETETCLPPWDQPWRHRERTFQQRDTCRGTEAGTRLVHLRKSLMARVAAGERKGGAGQEEAGLEHEKSQTTANTGGHHQKIWSRVMESDVCFHEASRLSNCNQTGGHAQSQELALLETQEACLRPRHLCTPGAGMRGHPSGDGPNPRQFRLQDTKLCPTCVQAPGIPSPVAIHLHRIKGSQLPCPISCEPRETEAR